MDTDNRIEITDKDGWRKEFQLQKRLIYIGSDPRNDIVLNAYRGGGVLPRHLQLVFAPGGSVLCSAVNLSQAAIQIGDAGDRQLPPSAAQEVRDGEKYRLGEFDLIFRLGNSKGNAGAMQMRDQWATVPARQSSKSIGIRAVFTQAALTPELPLDGTITVVNQGNAPGVQFKLGVEGLPADCYEIAAAPILFPGAEKGIPIRLFHPRRPGVPAGPIRITIWAEAEEAYPNERVVVTRDLRIMPYFSHTVRLTPVK